MADPEGIANVKVEDMEESRKNEHDDSDANDPASLCFKTYPPSVKRRIIALKKLQLKSTKFASEVSAETLALERKYFKNHFQPLFDMRGKITSGDYEPNDKECEWPSDDDEKEGKKTIGLDMDDDKTKKEMEGKEKEKSDNVKGIPDFWLTIFKNSPMLADIVQKHDEPILKHLMDVKVQYSESNPMEFVLEFHFSPNEYFTNSVLTKGYLITCEPDEMDPFSFDGSELCNCKGCTIDWKEGKNVTVKVVKKKLYDRAHNSVRIVTRTKKKVSFFNFFNPPIVPESSEVGISRGARAVLYHDYNVGDYIREKIVPHAVLYFTDEANFACDESDEETSDED